MEKVLTDKQLIHAYQKGDTKAFEVLYRRYKKAIYHYFFRQVHPPAAADELHQEVWLRIIKSTAGFNQQSSFKTWLYKIAHNQLVDYYRRSSIQPLHLVSDNTDINAMDHHPATSLSSEPDKILQVQQAEQALLNALDLLPDEQKEVFLLHEKSGLSLQEIALISNNSYESTKSRLRYAVKKLRQNMTHHQAAE